MHALTRIAAGTAMAGSLFFTAGLAPASAAPVQDGLVNVAVGDITVQDINVGAAVGLIVSVCGVKVGDVNVLVRRVDRTGDTATIDCPNAPGDAVVTQN